MKEKVFTNIDGQIAILRKRGITIESSEHVDYAKQILMQHGYYNLINGYSNLFLLDHKKNQVIYKKGTTLDEINGLFQFDRMLRSILLKYILKVETTIKSQVAYYFSELYGHKNYLIYPNFDSKNNNSDDINKLLASIQRKIADRSYDPSISHYLENYGYIPLWVLSNILTLGEVSKFYSLMKTPERQKISKLYKISDRELENALLYITPVRNISAHDNRLYCYRTKKPLVDTDYHSKLGLTRTDEGEFPIGKRDLFACMIALRKLLSNNDYSRMCKELNTNINILKNKLNVLTIYEVLSEMGFPRNWRKLEKL